MLPEPISSHASGALRKEIEHLLSLQVHDYGPVSGALAPCPVIDTDYPRFPFGAALLYPSFDTPQDRIIARRHSHSLDQALSGTPAEAMAEKVNDFGRSIGSSRSRSRHLGQLRRKCLTLAGFVSTLPTLETELYGYRGALRRQIL